VPPGTLDAVLAPPLFKRILCAIDFSDASLKALDYAISLAEEADAHLTLAHVVEVTPAPQSEASVESRSLGAYVAAAAQDRAGGCSASSPNLRARIARWIDAGHRQAYRELLRIIGTAQRADRARRARASIAELLFGSTAHHIVRQALSGAHHQVMQLTPRRAALGAFGIESRRTLVPFDDFAIEQESNRHRAPAGAPAESGRPDRGPRSSTA
jgi:nucleotide-binding universal stress UspA family protein